MTIRSILADKGDAVETTAPSATLRQAAKQLADARIGALVVTDHGAPVGMLSERDIVAAVGREGMDVLERPLDSVMARPVITCEPDEDIDHALGQMTDRRIRHLPVMESGRLAGIVSIGDLVKAKIAAAEGEAEAMRSYIQEA